MSENTSDSSQTIYNWPIIELIYDSRGDSEIVGLGTSPTSTWTQLSPTTFTLPPPLPLGLLDPALTLPDEEDPYDLTIEVGCDRALAPTHPTSLGDSILCVPWGCSAPKEGDTRRQPTFEVGFAPLVWISPRERWDHSEPLETVALVYRATTNFKGPDGRPAVSAEEEEDMLRTVGVDMETLERIKSDETWLAREERVICRGSLRRWARVHDDPMSTTKQIRKAKNSCSTKLAAAYQRRLEQGVASGEYPSFTVMPSYMSSMAAADRQAYGNANYFEPPETEDPNFVMERSVASYRARKQSRKQTDITNEDPFALPGVREEMCAVLGWDPYQTEQAIMHGKEAKYDSAYGTDEDRRTWVQEAPTSASGYRPANELLPDCESGIGESMPDSSPYPASDDLEHGFGPLSAYSQDKDVLGHFGSHLVDYQSKMSTAYPTMADMVQDLDIS